MALELCEEFKVYKEKTLTLSMLANIQHDLGNNEESLKSYNDALLFAEKVSEPEQIANIACHLAEVEMEIGSLKASQNHYYKALRYYRSHLKS
jgi:tetratricopeptide (TPR) repeat protein